MPKTVKKPKSKPALVAPADPEPWVDPLPNFCLPFTAQHTLMHRHMSCARHGYGNVSVYEHRKWIIERLWAHHTRPDGVNPIFETNEWSLRRLKSFCDNTFVMWMGPAGVGKTRDAAAIALEYWLEDPANTCVIVCSTTKDMLRKRIWNDICTLWNNLPDYILDDKIPTFKGVLTDTNCLIRFNENDKKNGIFGIAVAEGPTDEAVNNIIGIHTTRYVLMIDELQGVPDAIMDDNVLANIASNPSVKVLGMGNPTSMMSLLCKKITPVKGWNSVVRGVTPEWDIEKGPIIGNAKGLFFDGRKSPAVLDPAWGAKRLWMKQKAQVDAHIAAKGEDDPSVWTMTIGWPPPMGTDNTVLDVSIIEKFHCREKAHWTSGYSEAAALDPAFTEGGDSKILQFFKYGLVNDDLGDRWVIEFGEWFDVPINVDLRGADGLPIPVEYQLLNFCREKCQSKGIGAHEFATDSTGTGRGLCSIFRKEWGNVIGVEFGGGASDEVADSDGKTAREIFDRRSSELNIVVRNFANSNGIRGLPKKAEEEFCMRLTTQKAKHIVETKKDLKKRIGRSCDNSDACCIAVELCRQNGAYPGASGPATKEREQDVERRKYESDNMFDEGAIAQEDNWDSFANIL